MQLCRKTLVLKIASDLASYGIAETAYMLELLVRSFSCCAAIAYCTSRARFSKSHRTLPRNIISKKVLLDVLASQFVKIFSE